MLRPQEPECPGARPGIHASKGPTVTNLLVRLFVKNWQDSDNPAVRTRYGQLPAWSESSATSRSALQKASSAF